MKRIAMLGLLALTACGSTGTAVETRVQIERVPVPAPCPKADEYAALVAGQPVPLRSLPMPADPDVRVARTQAQLGKYEAKGGWADKVRAALDRCQKD